MPDAAHKTSSFNGFVGLIRRVKRRIRQLDTVAGCGVNAFSGLQNQQFQRACRPDKTRQRRIRQLDTVAGCGVNAFSGLQNQQFQRTCRPDKTRQRRIRHVCIKSELW
ncbi:hypothetical protein D9597_08510 [Escherichia sp. E13S3]|nr:hypothetical protein D9597_08510 [Escherichia sp. E13S3]